MAYASGEKRNASSSLGSSGPPGASGANVTASSPSPPSQPRKGNSSRPVLSARSTTSANGGPNVSGPLVASVLGGSYAYHTRNASPSPQRGAASPQHASSQRSTSASLQRTSSSRQRTSHGQIPGKPFFAAYGLQYSGNGRNGTGMGSATSRTSANMSPYRNRPSSSTGPPSGGAAAAAAAVMGRPSTSQAQQRASGENWFGNTKLSVTLPNEAARVVQELGQLLSVFAPPSPSGVPAGAKAPGSFRASKYVAGGSGGSSGSGGGGGPHKEAWGSGGGSGEMAVNGSGGGALLRPSSAASSTGSASKPVMAQFMGDGRHSHGQGANLSLMRLQQQQQVAYGGGGGTGGMLVSGTVAPQIVSQYQQQQYQQQQYQQHAGPGAGPGGPGSASYMHTPYMSYQSANGGGNVVAAQPPRLNLATVGSGSPAHSPKEQAAGGTSPGASPGASPHGPSAVPPGYPPSHLYPQSYPHAPNGPPPARPWDMGHGASSAAVAHLQPHPHTGIGPSYAAAAAGGTSASQLLSPRPSGGNSGNSVPYHYLPSVDGGFIAAAAGGSQGYTTTTVAANGASTQATYNQQPSSFQSAPPLVQTHGPNAPPSLSFNSAMAAAAMALGSHPPPQPLPVPTATGPVPLAPPSSLAPASHSVPLHLAAPIGSSSAAAALAPGPAAATMIYSPATKAMRESLIATASGNSSSGNISSPSPSSSSSQVQPPPPAGTAPGGSTSSATAPLLSTPLSALRSSSLANAPHPVGLPPPSPLKVAPPPGGAPVSARGTFIRSNSSRSSNCSGCDNGLYFNSILATVPDVEKEEQSSGGGTAAAGQPPTQTTPRTGFSSDGTLPIAMAPGGAAPPSPGFGATFPGGSGGHVTWGVTVTQGTSAPGTPTRMHNASCSDLTARRISISNQLEVGSPFARGAEGHSRMLVEHGTLTCLRPSTVPSNFAADSQTDLGAYGDLQGPALPGSGSDVQGSGGMYGGSGPVAAAASLATGQSWAPGGGPATGAAAYGQSAGTGPVRQSWRRSTDDYEQASGKVSTGPAPGSQQPQQPQPGPAGGSYAYQQVSQQQQADATAAPSAAAATPIYGTTREDGVWGRSRDSTPTRAYGHAPTPAPQPQQQQQQGGSHSAAEAASAATAAATASALTRRSEAAATTAESPSGAQRAVSSSSAAAPQATATSTAAAVSSAATAAAAASAAQLSAPPLPGDQPLRPKTVAPISPRYSPWSDTGISKPQPAATPAPATPTAAAPGAAITTTTTTAASTAAAATAATAAAASSASTAPSSSSPTAAASSSPAASSVAGSAVSSGSTSSGTVSSSYTAAGSTAGSAAAAAASHHLTAARRSGSIVARFNPASVLGTEPDANFGSLLPGYSVGKVIGEGGFCQVRLAVHHISQRKVAVKVIDRAKLVDPNEAKRMQREIRVMKHLSHQCVIKLFEVVESPRHLFLVMEHAPAGSLLDYVRARKRLPETDACVFFQQIVASLEYCHSREVVHRDIKLENILLDVDQRMKLIDFGLSAFFVHGKRLRVHCGSPSYAAPEIVARKAYEGPPVDVWSLGVVLFAMVAGYLPFHASGGNKQELCNKIIAGQYTAPDWLSASMKDLLSRMLTTDPDKRITFPQVWQHSWVRNGPQWHERGVNCYEVTADVSAPSGLRCDEQIVAELESAGYARPTLAQHLIAGEANHLTASYFLLCEAKADALRRMRGSSSAPRGRSGGSARSSQVSSSATTFGSAQLAAAVAKARAVESPGRSGGSSTSRPSTAAGGGGGVGYSSARGHRTPHQGEEMGIGAAGRMAVAV